MDTKEQRIKQLDTILAQPKQSDRWRGIRQFLLAYNPKVAAMDKGFVESLSETRNDQLNDFGSNKAMNIRQLMDMPTYLYEALITADPELERQINSKDRKEQTNIWRKLAAAFPEYKIARKI